MRRKDLRGGQAKLDSVLKHITLTLWVCLPSHGSQTHKTLVLHDAFLTFLKAIFTNVLWTLHVCINPGIFKVNLSQLNFLLRHLLESQPLNEKHSTVNSLFRWEDLIEHFYIYTHLHIITILSWVYKPQAWILEMLNKEGDVCIYLRTCFTRVQKGVVK